MAGALTLVGDVSGGVVCELTTPDDRDCRDRTADDHGRDGAQNRSHAQTPPWFATAAYTAARQTSLLAGHLVGPVTPAIATARPREPSNGRPGTPPRYRHRHDPARWAPPGRPTSSTRDDPQVRVVEERRRRRPRAAPPPRAVGSMTTAPMPILASAAARSSGVRRASASAASLDARVLPRQRHAVDDEHVAGHVVAASGSGPPGRAPAGRGSTRARGSSTAAAPARRRRACRRAGPAPRRTPLGSRPARAAARPPGQVRAAARPGAAPRRPRATPGPPARPAPGRRAPAPPRRPARPAAGRRAPAAGRRRGRPRLRGRAPTAQPTSPGDRPGQHRQPPADHPADQERGPVARPAYAATRAGADGGQTDAARPAPPSPGAPVRESGCTCGVPDAAQRERGERSRDRALAVQREDLGRRGVRGGRRRVQQPGDQPRRVAGDHQRGPPSRCVPARPRPRAPRPRWPARRWRSGSRAGPAPAGRAAAGPRPASGGPRPRTHGSTAYPTSTGQCTHQQPLGDAARSSRRP